MLNEEERTISNPQSIPSHPATRPSRPDGWMNWYSFLLTMITNNLFRECLASIPEDTRAELELSFCIAERIAAILKSKGLTQRDFADMMGKRESEVSKWLTGRHNFTTNTIARIQLALGEDVICVPSSVRPYHFDTAPSASFVADEGKPWTEAITKIWRRNSYQHTTFLYWQQE